MSASVQFISIFFTVSVLGFYVVMFVDMVRNPNIPANERFFWLLGFIFLSLLTAGYYYFTQYRGRN